MRPRPGRASEHRDGSPAGEAARAGAPLDPRRLALELLLKRERTRGDASALLRELFAGKGAGLSERERAFVRQLVLGTVERLLSIDYLLDRRASVKTKDMKPAIRADLRLGTYQILFLDAVRDAAAVDEAVKLVKGRFPDRLTGFVNAVLRRIAREKEGCLAMIREAEPQIRYSMPAYLCQLFARERGQEAAERMMTALLESRPLTIRPDSRLLADAAGYAAWEEALAERVGGLRRHPLLPSLLLVEAPGDVRSLPGFRQGLFVVQDAASALAVEAAAIRPGDRVLDVCAAPGGKSIGAAALLEDPSQLLARDISEEKCALIRENAARMKLEGLRVQAWDARERDPSLEGRFDVVFCDLPCSGYGVIGRKPEIRYHASEDRTASLVELQRSILEACWRYVRPGGTLLYSTCTVSREENEGNVEWFLEGHPFAAAPWSGVRLPEVLRERVEGSCLQLLPGDFGTDGFFIARLERLERGERDT